MTENDNKHDSLRDTLSSNSNFDKIDKVDKNDKVDTADKVDKVYAPQLVVEKPIAGSIDHLAISKSLGYQIFRKDRRNAWSSDEDKCLKASLIKQHLKINNLSSYNNEPINIKLIDWSEIANQMHTKRKGKECKKRWVSSLDPFIRKGKWTQTEDNSLIEAYKKHGPSWQKVASEIEGRNEDQCSKRYTEVLNSDTKERLKPWSLEEDLILIEKVKQYGTKWRQISTSLPTRPSLTCRNRWRKIMTDIAKDSASDIIKKAVGVLDENGRPIVKFKKSKDLENDNYDKDFKNNNKKRVRDSTTSSPNDSINETADSDKHNPDQNRGNNKKFKRQNNISSSNNYNTNDNDINIATTYPRMVTPSKTQTDWTFSLVDPQTNEEMKSYAGTIDNQNLAHYLIELAKFNGVTLTVHQHIHHHYSSSASNITIDPQSNISRYGHFNYLPPLTEVPKLTSSSSPDNTIESNNSNKNYNENSLLKLLNNEDGSNDKNKHSKNQDRKENDKNNESSKRFSVSHRQQLYPSNNNNNSQFQHDVNIRKEKTNKNSNKSSSSNKNDNNNNDNGKDIREDIEGELDFWETLRSINYSKNNKPVSQHHPLHYNQPSNYKEQWPYQPSDSFGIQRFPNMATPLAMITSDNTTDNNNNNIIKNIQTNIKTNINADNNYAGIYMGAQDDEDDDDEEEEMDIANQYGMYYSVFANKGGQSGVYNNYGKGKNNNIGPTGLVNSGYLMPFNPS